MMVRQLPLLFISLFSAAAVAQQPPTPAPPPAVQADAGNPQPSQDNVNPGPKFPVQDFNPVPKLTPETINQQTEILRNPGLAVDNAKQTLMPPDTQQQPDYPPPVTEGPVDLTHHHGRIKDPTEMTGSFSQALSRMTGNPGIAGPGPSSAPQMPEISLVAMAIRHQDNKAAILRVGGKDRFVKLHGKCSFMANNILYEIRVNKIEKDHVVVTVLPMDKEITLE